MNARLVTGNASNHAHSVEEVYRNIYYEVSDQVTSSLSNRFHMDSE